MPATEFPPNVDTHSSLGHVNLMLDSFIANADPDDLRAILRNFLATSPPTLAAQFKTVAQGRFKQSRASAASPSTTLFSKSKSSHNYSPTRTLHQTVTRARSLYGVGMGFASLRLLTEVVRRTLGIRWHEDDEVADTLAVIDSDITQAIQSCKEEITRIRGESDFNEAREIVTELRACIEESKDDVNSWGGEFPFDRASASLDYWKI